MKTTEDLINSMGQDQPHPVTYVPLKMTAEEDVS